jgi:hypothetical protein
MKFAYNQDIKWLNLLAPQDVVATATASAYMNVQDAAGLIEVSVPFGAVASTDSTGGVTVTVEASTAGSSNATETAIAFNYRLSGAVATDSMGAITAATSTGVVVTEADDNKTLFVYLDPSQFAALGNDFKYFRVVATPTAEITSTVLGGVHARFRPRYAGNAIPSST